MKNPAICFVVLMAAAMAVIGCNSSTATSPTGPAALQSTTYQYLAYDQSGRVVASGTLSLAFEASAVTGQRDIKGSAPEAGAGTVSGQELPDGTVHIELNPNSAAVVVLQGKFQGNELSGTRLLDTGDPPVNRTLGTFMMFQSSAGTP